MSDRPPVIVRLILSLILAFVALTANAAQSRVVAIGDVHGAYGALLDLLVAADLVDGRGDWIGGDATLVQVGDLIDRGAYDRKVLEFMMGLDKKARRSGGGRVIALLGNHEVMNLHGDLRYVSPQSFASFATSRSEQGLRKVYDKYLKLKPLESKEGEAPVVASWESFRANHPLGFVEHRQWFSPKSDYGKWLRERPAIAQIGDVIFMHGGFHPEVAAHGIAKINEQIQIELQIFDSAREYLVKQKRTTAYSSVDEVVAAARAELDSGASIKDRDRQQLELLANYGGWLVAHPNGPLWFRGLAQWPDEEIASQVPAMLKGLNAKHIIVGHTAQLKGGIVSRLNGAIYLIDTGILDGTFYPGGVVQALEWTDGQFQVIDRRGSRSPVPDVHQRFENPQAAGRRSRSR
ncbi:MAG: metallophosphoesterase [Gammaproteobacteria bacterium]|jgi:hypothetical protein